MADRWLDFETLCLELNLKPKQVRRLIKAGKVVGICHGHPRRVETDWRYLDPSPKYKRTLHMLEQITINSLQFDIAEFPVLASAEFAILCNISQSRVRGLIHRGILKPYKVGKYSFFTPNQVRNYVKRREHSQLKVLRPPMQMLLDWCASYIATQGNEFITKAAVRKDDALEGEIQKMLRLAEPERSRALKTFWRRWELAKQVSTAARAT